MLAQKILVVAETIDVDASSAGKANIGFVHSLRDSNFKVHVLHYSHKEIKIEGVSVSLIPTVKKDSNYLLSRSQRVLQRITKRNFSRALENRFGVSFTFKSDAFSIAKAIKKITFQPDLIITLSKGASYRTHAALLQLPSLHHIWLAYVHDPYPFHLYPPPYNWQEAGHTQKEAFFRKVSQKAAFSGFPSLKLKEWMGQFFPNFLKTGSILPHQQIAETPEMLEEIPYFDANKCTLLHAGNLLGYRDPFPVLEAYQLFLNENPTAAQHSNLIFLGPASYHEPEFSKKCKAIKSVIKSEGYVAFDEVFTLQQKVTANIIIEADATISPFLPGKFPHCIQSKKPIFLIGTANSESKRLLGNDYPYFAKATDIEGIKAVFANLYHIWNVDKQKLRLDRKDLEDYFTSDYLQAEIIKLIPSK